MEANKARLALVVSVVVTCAMYALPEGRYAIYPLLLLSTFVHELGHGFTALLVDGQFSSLKVWSDGSGAAAVSVVPGWRSALVSAGGLVGPAVGAAACFFGARWERLARWSFWLLGIGSLFVGVWVVRNPTGWAIAATFGAISLLIARFAPNALCRVLLLFVGIQFALSVFSNADYLFTATAQTSGGSGPSDVSNIANEVGGPYWFWGAFVGAFSVVVIAIGMYANLRGSTAPATTPTPKNE